MEKMIKVEDCVKYSGKFSLVPTYNAIIIPDNATNGDVIKAMFPNVIIEESTDTLHLKYETVNSDPLFCVQVSKKWWDAPYKK